MSFCAFWNTSIFYKEKEMRTQEMRLQENYFVLVRCSNGVTNKSQSFETLAVIVLEEYFFLVIFYSPDNERIWSVIRANFIWLAFYEFNCNTCMNIIDKSLKSNELCMNYNNTWIITQWLSVLVLHVIMWPVIVSIRSND